jgi:hypothetical protein
MVALVIGLVATIIGILVHVLLLRRWSGRWLFVSVPALLVVALAIAAFGCRAVIGVPGLMDVFLALTLTMSLGLSYVLLLVGVIYDSPTLALTNAIADCGPEGMPASALPDVAKRHPFVRTRLAALITSGQIKFQGDDVVACQPAASGLIRVGEAYRRWRGANAPAG